MKALFWVSVGLAAYAYAGYPAWLWLRSRLVKRPVHRSSVTPSISIVMVVRNEERVLQQKLRNLLELDYPAGLLEFVIVSDGSTDGTERILKSYAADPRVHLVISSTTRGKASGLNEAMRMAKNEVVVFTDARQQIEPSAVRLLVENFADPVVGCASGELMLGDREAGETGKGMGLYWRIEKQVREMESCSGSVVGATGAFYAARRELIVEVPAGTILDDVYIPMSIARQGRRVIFDPRAQAWDSPDLGGRREFSRKIRTLSGNYQLLQSAPWLLGSSNPIRFEFMSHKLMRLAVPFAMVAALISSAVARGTFFTLVFWTQVAIYALSLLALTRVKLGPLSRVADAASTLVILNAAALAAFINFVTGKKATWTPIAAPGSAPAVVTEKEVRI